MAYVGDGPLKLEECKIHLLLSLVRSASVHGVLFIVLFEWLQFDVDFPNKPLIYLITSVMKKEVCFRYGMFLSDSFWEQFYRLIEWVWYFLLCQFVVFFELVRCVTFFPSGVSLDISELLCSSNIPGIVQASALPI